MRTGWGRTFSAALVLIIGLTALGTNLKARSDIDSFLNAVDRAEASLKLLVAARAKAVDAEPATLQREIDSRDARDRGAFPVNMQAAF